MDLRNRFGINLIGARRGDRVFSPKDMKKYLVEKGDMGIVCRIPDNKTGISRRVLGDEAFRRLAEAEFARKPAPASAVP